MSYDIELPAGFQDADFEMRSLQAKGARSSALKRRGICDHGWLQGPPGKPIVTCNHCGKEFASFEAAYAEHDELHR